MSESYKRYRHPKSVIGYAVRLYLRYCLSYRDVQEILLERGIELTYETIRAWVYRWGSAMLAVSENAALDLTISGILMKCT